ncbi:MAG: IS4 family transposase, partial [Albidovulum sp.]|nr:IS4 family transposase [Albidovulum sp.]
KSARGSTARSAREARQAACELRWKPLEIPVPEKKRGRFGARPFKLAAVHVSEESDPADGSERLEWLLPATLPIADESGAREAPGLYALRWRIEDWHRILKSGCKVEEIAHATAERIQRAAAINAVIAWRLAALTLCGRETPELDAASFFSDVEIAVLSDFAAERRVKGPENLGQAMNLVAAMGGHLHRKHDRPPGSEVVWLGCARLADASQAAERARRLGSESAMYKLLRPD